MATHNADDGTGGLDGSIVYELGRPEVSPFRACLACATQPILELRSRFQPDPQRL